VFWVLFFCSKYFFTISMENNNKMAENDLWTVWVQKQVIMYWFVSVASFRSKLPKLLIVISCVGF